jgi:hypothetical protein
MECSVAVTTAILNLINTPCFMFYEVWWKKSIIFKFVQPIPILLAYLVLLDVDVVPIKFHQFMFVPTMFHEVWWKK